MGNLYRFRCSGRVIVFNIRSRRNWEWICDFYLDDDYGGILDLLFENDLYRDLFEKN